MKILFFAQHYAPEDVSGAVLATELTGDLVKRGHTVRFVTAAPSYPLGKVYPGYRNSFLSRQVEQGVEVLRVWSYISPRRAFWARALNFATFSLFALVGGLRAGRPDVIFSYSPPLPLGLAAWLLSILYRVPWVLRVEDLFPDAAIAAGALRNKWAIRFFQWLERFLYKRAQRISVISEGFRDILLKKSVPDEKISVDPIWADPDFVKPMPKENAFRVEHASPNAFVVLYSGNIGQTSALDEVLATAEILHDDPAFQFIIVGEGIHKDRLVAEACQRNISNLKFLPYQPRERFSEMLAASDVCLVTLNDRSANYSLPCKTFNYMASARPILAVTPADSELSRLVQSSGCGYAVPPNDPHALVDALRSLRSDPRCSQNMGQIGREVLQKQFSRSFVINQYETLLASVIE